MKRVMAWLGAVAVCWCSASASSGQGSVPTGPEWNSVFCTPRGLAHTPGLPDGLAPEFRFTERGDVWINNRSGGIFYKGIVTQAEMTFVDKDGDRWRLSRVTGLMTVDDYVFVCGKPKL